MTLDLLLKGLGLFEVESKITLPLAMNVSTFEKPRALKQTTQVIHFHDVATNVYGSQECNVFRHDVCMRLAGVRLNHSLAPFRKGTCASASRTGIPAVHISSEDRQDVALLTTSESRVIEFARALQYRNRKLRARVQL